MTFAGKSLDGIKKAGGVGGKFVEDYTTKYGHEPNSSYAMYGGVAMQVILKAIAASDGTRQGVLDAVFAGDPVCLTAEESISGMGFCLSTETGDVDTVTMTLQQMTGGVETDVQEIKIG
jgi:ABC-type branched-subunit amino acid transport system substrate-binding protein